MIENRIKDVDSKDNSVNIMFRPTHFVILFAVVLYANALPAPPSDLALKEPEKIAEIGGLKSPTAKQLTPGVEDKTKSVKDDLATAAQTHIAYSYHSPRWGYGPGQGSKSGWGIELIKPYAWAPVPVPLALPVPLSLPVPVPLSLPVPVPLELQPVPIPLELPVPVPLALY